MYYREASTSALESRAAHPLTQWTALHSCTHIYCTFRYTVQYLLHIDTFRLSAAAGIKSFSSSAVSTAESSYQRGARVRERSATRVRVQHSRLVLVRGSGARVRRPAAASPSPVCSARWASRAICAGGPSLVRRRPAQMLFFQLPPPPRRPPPPLSSPRPPRVRRSGAATRVQHLASPNSLHAGESKASCSCSRRNRNRSGAKRSVGPPRHRRSMRSIRFASLRTGTLSSTEPCCVHVLTLSCRGAFALLAAAVPGAEPSGDEPAFVRVRARD